MVETPSTMTIEVISSSGESCKEIHNILELNPSSKKTSDEKDKRHPIRDDALATTEFDALLHVVKASLGSGILAMPYAFKNAGLLLGVFGTVLVAALCTHGTYLIVKCSQELCYLYDQSSLGYVETVETAFQHSHFPLVRRFSTCMRRLASVFLFLTYYGATAIYILLIASTLQQVLFHHFSVDWSTRLLVLALAPPLIMVGMVHRMKYLVPFSAGANLCLLVGLAMTFWETVQDLPPLSSRQLFVADFSKFSLFFSTALCGMEGIGTILPIENSMRNPKKLLGCSGILNTAMICNTILFSTIGFFGYLKYGEDVKDSLTLNMGNDFFSELVKLSVALAVFLTFGLQFTPCFEIAWKVVQPNVSEKNETKCFYVTRALLILGTVLFGVAVPQLAPVISLVGSVGFAVLGLLLPAATDAVVFWRSDGAKNWWRAKNALMAVAGLLTLVAGSAAAIRDIRDNCG